ncbi:MAG TPA: hypothetical protein VHT91_17140 [Kofleriaceae bacterium]|nr:hypothetical protein [Kofleriaceae bacterium]
MTRRAALPLELAAVLGLALGAALPAGCVVRHFTGPDLTGTCNGACDHYVECKPGHASADRNRCLAECPDVFSDRDSLMTYESLACDDAVEYVDGSAPARAVSHR